MLFSPVKKDSKCSNCEVTIETGTVCFNAFAHPKDLRARSARGGMIFFCMDCCNVLQRKKIENLTEKNRIRGMSTDSRGVKLKLGDAVCYTTAVCSRLMMGVVLKLTPKGASIFQGTDVYGKKHGDFYPSDRILRVDHTYLEEIT